MGYLFDASAVYAIIKAGKTRLLILNNTCDLARYELGNILLTERNIRKTMGESEQKFLLNAIAQSLNFMNKIDVEENEQGIIDLAIKYNLSFYDASYAYLAKKNGSVLVTEDSKLATKIKSYTGVTTAADLI